MLTSIRIIFQHEETHWIFETGFAMKMLIASLWWLLVSVHHCVSLPMINNIKVIRKLTKACTLVLKKRMHRRLNYSMEKAAIKGLVKTPSAHRRVRSHTKVMLLILAGMLCLHFTSCLHAKSHQLKQSWTACSWHSAMQDLKGINGQLVVGMKFIKGRKM